MDDVASWKAKQEEEARKRRSRPEAGELVFESMQLLDEATERLFEAGELELADRAHFLLGVLWGVYDLDDYTRTT